MNGNKAGLNRNPSVERKLKRLERVRAAITQIETQLETPFRSKESKKSAEDKVEKLKREELETMALLKAAKAEIEEFLKANG